MFTGIVEHMGLIQTLEFTNNDPTQGATIVISQASPILTDCHIGDSISVNGTCLTVTEFTKDTFTVELIPETLNRTNLGDLQRGDKVNLERAVGGDVRFGGHYVQGHVDAVAVIDKMDPNGDAIDFSFKFPSKERDNYLKYIVEKGFVAIDGVSLTVTFVNYQEGTFGISMIKHTQAVVVLPLKQIGGKVNIEVDLTGKLIEKQVELYLGGENSGLNANEGFVKIVEGIVERKVKELLNK
ncbi:hypothetical protein WICPIJ_009329 [Wickerhamomyces pijperi]|uniref:Riboflavin synthase n=1 Tax=Wickerhamomyces pijperi TaxID=599730 RepID=A0A9P8PQR2_WICPI|nr:hypothetical protein WICPIJ_009329 [Wickerhamomyces pijperi]